MSDPTFLQYVLIFVGIPAVVVVLIVLAIMGPGWTRAGGYRPGEPWDHEPVLINAAITGDVREAVKPTPVSELGSLGYTGDGLGTSHREGGASARW